MDNPCHCNDGQTDSEASGPISNEEWADWLSADLQRCPAYAEYGSLLDKCCTIAAGWRERFWDRKHIWNRIRGGRRLAKELSEVVPVLSRVLREVTELDLAKGDAKVVVVDLCSGFGYMGMFLSELLPPEKVERILLVDIMWARPDVEPGPHHINADHIHDPRWPIRLSTSRANLKVPSDRRSLGRAFLSHGNPAILLGVHLCSTLSLRCIELYNDCPGFFFLALKPCCLPESQFAKRGEVFGLSNGHCFPARAVAVTGRWNRGKWVGGAGKDELERKYGLWVHNLSRCVECAGEECDGTADDAGTGAGTDAGTAVEYHRVQPSWFLNSFIFGTRPWSAAPPRSLSYVAANNAHAAEGAPAGAPVGASPLTHTPNTSNKSGLSAARRAQVIEDWNASRRAEKHTRRMGRKTPEQRMVAEARWRAYVYAPIHVRLEVLGAAQVQLCCMLETHKDTYVRLGIKGRKG